MQTPSLPSITNLGATPQTSKSAESSAESHFGQMLEQQMTRRDAAKPIEASKPATAQQGTKAPTNPAGTANVHEGDSQDPPADAAPAVETAASSPAKPGAADKKDVKVTVATDGKERASPVDTTLAASAAIMALVANAGSKASNTAPLDAAAASGAIDAAGNGGSAAAINLATKGSARQGIETATGEAATGKASTDGFGPALHTAGTALAGEAAVSNPVDLARRAGDEVAQITPQMQQTVFEIAPPAVPHPGDILAPRVGNDSWNQALGQRMVWMVAGSEQSASLTLNPPDLGPMQVVLHVSNGQADASFFAAQPEVRQALEAALPKLREMLGEAGVTLGQASVSAGQPQQQQTPDQRQSGSRNTGSRTIDAAVTTAISGTSMAGRRIDGRGMVDTFA